jgi:hypothetical protein
MDVLFSEHFLSFEVLPVEMVSCQPEAANEQTKNNEYKN